MLINAHTHTHAFAAAAPALTRAGLDPALLAAAIEHHDTSARPRFELLWAYYRNPMRLGGSGAAPGRRIRLAQERGLPARLTGPRDALADDRAPAREVVVENDIAWRIHTMVDFMFGRPITIVSTARSPALRRRIERLLDAVFEASGGAALMADIGLLGHVYGHIDLVIRADLAPVDPPAHSTTDDNNHTDLGADPALIAAARGIRIEPVEPIRGTAILDPDDYRRIIAYVIRSPRHHAAPADEDLTASPRRTPIGLARWLTRFNPAAAGASPHDRVPIITEVITPAARQVYLQDAPDLPARLIDAAPALVSAPDAAADSDHAPVPIIHIQNIAQPFRYEGLSEVEPLIPLQNELNTRLSDRASRVTMQSFKMYLAKGLDAADRLSVGPGQIWSTDNTDASVEAFGGDGDSPSEDAHIQEIREALDKASGVPPLASGVVRAKIGNLTSENALRITLMGLLSKTARKRVTYGRGLAEACRLILLALHRAGILETDEDDRNVRIEWPDPLPRDERDTLDAALRKVELGVPRERILSELGYAPTDPGIV